MSYKYLLYGLKVDSEIEIEEAYREDFGSVSDVKVNIGEMPNNALEMCSDFDGEGVYAAVSADAMVFRALDTADFYVRKENITISPHKGADERDVRSFLLGSGFGYCMILRKQILLHGGAVSKNGKGVIITGESGAGKSTVSDALSSRDYLFVADDGCAISFEEEKPHINMGYPQKKLCRDAALKKGYNLSDLIYINEDRDKFALRLKDGFLPGGASFDYLFELKCTDEDELSIKEVQGHEKLMMILRNVFRSEDGFRFWGVPTEYMQQCLKIASTVSMYQITRPRAKDTLSEILDFIEKIV